MYTEGHNSIFSSSGSLNIIIEADEEIDVSHTNQSKQYILTQYKTASKTE